jgi:hypothetical protein
MILKRTALLFLLITASAVCIYAEASWSSAVGYFNLGKDLNPHRMNVLSKTYNGKGEIEKTEEMLYLLSYDADGESVNELIRAIENGKDITEKKKKETSRHGERGGGPPGNSEDFQKSPLDPDLQDDVSASDTGIIQYKAGERCVVWNFRMKLNNDLNAVGKAWISEKTGAAVSLIYQLEPDFPFVEEMNIGLNYITDGSGRWLLDELHFDGRINMIIMKKSFDSVTSFSDYR